MQFITFIKSKLPSLVALSFALMLASCGSYQYVGYDSDGIYDDQVVIYQEEQTVPAPTDNNSEYKDYFDEKSEQYDAIPQEDVIFTDIDSYSSNTYNDQEPLYVDEIVTGYPGWGQGNTEVVINYQTAGFGAWGWGSRWGWGFNNPWRFGLGWGYGGFYDPFWCPPYYGNGFGWGYGYGYGWNRWNRWYGNPYYGNGFYNRYNYYAPYSRRGYAYNRYDDGRYYNNTSVRNRGNVTRRSYDRNTSVRDRNSSVRYSDGTTRSRTRINTPTRTRSNTTIRRSSNSRTPARVRTTSPNRSRSSGNAVRRSSPNRSSSPSVRRSSSSSSRNYSPSRSSSSSRFSGSVRSSGGSSRSSGSSSRGSSRRGGN